MKVVSGIGIQEVIDEEKAGLGDYSDSDDDVKKKSKKSRSGSSDNSGDGSEDSSIDAGCEDDEEKLYQQIIQAQSSKETDKDKGIDDLVDKDMIDLLKVCSHFSCPSIDELSMKFVNFGQPTRQKVLVLDMDETLIHAKFL
jgi:hypothetical protein